MIGRSLKQKVFEFQASDACSMRWLGIRFNGLAGLTCFSGLDVSEKCSY